MLVLFGCTAAYKNLQQATGDVTAITKFKPVITSVLYKTQVNVIGKYLSGLLLLKTMPDSSVRIVFSNEMGLTFFDFAFLKDGSFKVFSIIKQMDKKAVIKTLRKDFELVLMQNMHTQNAYLRKDSSLLYYVFPQTKGFYYYITSSNGSELVRMERVSITKPVVQAIMKNYIGGAPDTIGISHLNFNFTISLKRIER